MQKREKVGIKSSAFRRKRKKDEVGISKLQDILLKKRDTLSSNMIIYVATHCNIDATELNIRS